MAPHHLFLHEITSLHRTAWSCRVNTVEQNCFFFVFEAFWRLCIFANAQRTHFLWKHIQLGAWYAAKFWPYLWWDAPDPSVSKKSRSEKITWFFKVWVSNSFRTFFAREKRWSKKFRYQLGVQVSMILRRDVFMYTTIGGVNAHVSIAFIVFKLFDGREMAH